MRQPKTADDLADLLDVEVDPIKAPLCETFDLSGNREEPDQGVLALLPETQCSTVLLVPQRGLSTPPLTEK
jgi:hypothetical protein